MWWKDERATIILDGRVFSKNRQLMQVTEFAERLGQQWRVIECVCSETAAKKRIAADQQHGTHPAANRSAALYDSVKSRFEAIPQPKIVVDTESKIDMDAIVDGL